MTGTITYILARAGFRAMNGPLADERRRLAGAEPPAAYVSYDARLLAGAGWYGYRIAFKGGDRDLVRRALAMLAEYYIIRDGYEYYEGGVYVVGVLLRQRVPHYGIGGGAPTPAPDYMYFEAAQANSTVSLVSSLTTAPSLEYSTDGGRTWNAWQYTMADNVHTFDIITLGTIGDRVYLRGDNPSGVGSSASVFSTFYLSGSIKAGGNIMSLLDKTLALTEVPAYGFYSLFYDGDPSTALITAPIMATITAIGNNGCRNMYRESSLTAAADMPSLAVIGTNGCREMYENITSLTKAADMSSLTTIGENGCYSIYYGCTSLTAAANMPLLTTIDTDGCYGMYVNCTFDMSDDGTTLNFDFPTPPFTAGGTTYSTPYDVAVWMGNTNGFTNP